MCWRRYRVKRQIYATRNLATGPGAAWTARRADASGASWLKWPGPLTNKLLQPHPSVQLKQMQRRARRADAPGAGPGACLPPGEVTTHRKAIMKATLLNPGLIIIAGALRRILFAQPQRCPR